MGDWLVHSTDALVDSDSYVAMYEPFSCIISYNASRYGWESKYAFLTNPDRGWKTGAKFDIIDLTQDSLGQYYVRVLYRRNDPDWSHEFSQFTYDEYHGGFYDSSWSISNIVLPECSNAEYMFGYPGNTDTVSQFIKVRGPSYLNFSSASSLYRALGNLTIYADQTNGVLNIVWPDEWFQERPTTAVAPSKFRFIFIGSRIYGQFGAFSPVTSGLKNMTDLFEGARGADITNFDMSSCEWAGSLYGEPSYAYDATAPGSTNFINTGNLRNTANMFTRCNSLSIIPSFGDLSSLTSCNYMFYDCRNVNSGILDMYNRLKDIPGLSHTQTFYNCGINSPTGSQELAQIPSDWK